MVALVIDGRAGGISNGVNPPPQNMDDDVVAHDGQTMKRTVDSHGKRYSKAELMTSAMVAVRVEGQ